MNHPAAPLPLDADDRSTLEMWAHSATAPHAHPRFEPHFTPTGASWLNLVESWFSQLTQRRLRRGVFCSVPELVAAIQDYLTHHNADPKPFVWSTTVEAILDKVSKCKVIPGAYHQRGSASDLRAM